MEVKVCDDCGSLDTSEDLSNGELTCLKCGHKSKGHMIDFTGVRENEKTVKHSPRFRPFEIQPRIKKQGDISLIPRPVDPFQPPSAF